MNKLFLILVPPNLERDEAIAHLNSVNAISFWFYNMPYSFYVRSNLTANQLQNIITTKFPTVDKILIINITRNIDFSGLVPNDHVQLYNNI